MASSKTVDLYMDSISGMEDIEKIKDWVYLQVSNGVKSELRCHLTNALDVYGLFNSIESDIMKAVDAIVKKQLALRIKNLEDMFSEETIKQLVEVHRGPFHQSVKELFEILGNKLPTLAHSYDRNQEVRQQISAISENIKKNQ